MTEDVSFFRRKDFDVTGPPREIVGYGEHPPMIRWGGDAKVAIQLVVNYEEGSEKTYAMGDNENDILYELPFALEGQRDLAVESMYEYGSRAGIWRLFRVFDNAGIPVTFFAAAVALERNPAVAAKLASRGDEPAGHGYRWSNAFEMTRDQEREAMRRAISSSRRAGSSTTRTATATTCRTGRASAAEPTSWCRTPSSSTMRAISLEPDSAARTTSSLLQKPRWTGCATTETTSVG
jgi:peptidoglycan/xylan/chitin deacetylase (PgdA/CDA1 family)